jgi:hypothetical protein
VAELHIVQWVNDLGELVEVDVPIEDAEKLAQGKPIAGCWPERRYTGREARDRLREQAAGYRARNDQIRSRLDELVDANPRLKSV